MARYIEDADEDILIRPAVFYIEEEPPFFMRFSQHGLERIWSRREVGM